MEKNIVYEVKSLENAISRYIFSHNEDKIYLQPPSPMQIMIIDYLLAHQNDKVYQKDLELVFKVRRSSLSGVLKTLQKRGFIRKNVSDIDSRTNRIVLTKKAMTKEEDVSSFLKEIENELIKDIDKEKLDIFFEVLKDMKNNIDLLQ